MVRAILALAMSLTALPVLAGTPSEAVAYFYKDPGSELSADNRDRFTGKAKEILDLSDKTDDSEDGPCINFMLSLDAQDFDEDEVAKSLKLAESIEGDKATVDATYMLFGEPGEVVWSLEKAGDAWKVSDIFSPSEAWRLTEMDCK